MAHVSSVHEAQLEQASKAGQSVLHREVLCAMTRFVEDAVSRDAYPLCLHTMIDGSSSVKKEHPSFHSTLATVMTPLPKNSLIVPNLSRLRRNAS